MAVMTTDDREIVLEHDYVAVRYNTKRKAFGWIWFNT